MAGKLLASTTGTAFEVFTVEDDGFELLSGRERLHVLEWEKEAWNPANVLGTEIFEHAMKLNLHYAHLYGDVEENMELEWGKLDGFTRYSNVSAADEDRRMEHGCYQFEPGTDGTSGRTRTYPVVQVSSVSQLANGNSEKWCEKRCHASDPQGSDTI